MKECIDCKLSASKLPNFIIFKPRNPARISEKRKEYMEACGESSSQIFQQRYHEEEVEERFGKFKPGVIRYLFSFHLLLHCFSGIAFLPLECQMLLSRFLLNPSATYNYGFIMFELVC